MVLTQLIVYTLILKTLTTFHKLFDKEGLISDRMGKRSPGGIVALPELAPWQPEH
jgi:hypothetical protein